MGTSNRSRRSRVDRPAEHLAAAAALTRLVGAGAAAKTLGLHPTTVYHYRVEVAQDPYLRGLADRMVLHAWEALRGTVVRARLTQLRALEATAQRVITLADDDATKASDLAVLVREVRLAYAALAETELTGEILRQRVAQDLEQALPALEAASDVPEADDVVVDAEVSDEPLEAAEDEQDTHPPPGGPN